MKLMKAIKSVEHSKYIVETAEKGSNFLCLIITGTQPKGQSAECKSKGENRYFQKSQINTMLITFCDSKRIFLKEFLSEG